MSNLRRIITDRSGASAVEFALVSPLLILLMFGILDVSRFLWDYNQVEKATQMGVRYAVVTDPVPSGLTTYKFASSGMVPAGDRVPDSDPGGGIAWFSKSVCNNTTCTCTGSADLCAVIGYNGTAFANIVARMQAMYGRIGPENVEIEYRNVRLGYAGDPNGPDVAPLVTVRIKGLSFQPLAFLFTTTFTMPSFSSALTLEDGSGDRSN